MLVHVEDVGKSSMGCNPPYKAREAISGEAMTSTMRKLAMQTREDALLGNLSVRRTLERCHPLSVALGSLLRTREPARAPVL